MRMKTNIINQLKKRISSLTQIIDLQNKVIVELNNIQITPESVQVDVFCDENHRGCKILHRKYNYRRPIISKDENLVLSSQSVNPDVEK